MNSNIFVIAGNRNQYDWWISNRYYYCFWPYPEVNELDTLTEHGQKVYKTFPALRQALCIDSKTKRHKSRKELPRYIYNVDQLRGVSDIILVFTGHYIENQMYFPDRHRAGQIIRMLFDTGKVCWIVYDDEIEVDVETLSGENIPRT